MRSIPNGLATQSTKKTLMKLPKHNGIIGTVNISKIFELSVSMDRMNPNLVNASQNKCKKRKKDFEIGEI